MKIVVIGAGITGLAAAHRFLETAGGRPVDLRIFEASGRAGGVISTQSRDGFIWEDGPDSFLTEKPEALNLCRRLGLEDEIIGTNPRFRKSFVAWKGRLHRTPEGFYLLAPSRVLPFLGSSLFSWRGKARMLAEMFRPGKEPGQDESLASFVRRRFGAEALDRMAQPMVAGIYGADPEQLSLRATFPRFLEMEKTGGVLRGLWSGRFHRDGGAASGPRYGLFAALRRGMASLVDALTRALPEGALRLNAPVREIRREGDAWKVVLAGGESETADLLCAALPAPAAAPLFAGWNTEIADALRKIPYGSAAVVNMAYRRRSVEHPLNGFGFVVPSAEGRTILGCTFSSVKFPGRAPEGQVLLRAFLGGAALRRLDSTSDAGLIPLVRRDVEDLLRIRDTPLFVSVARHPASMPHYTVGHLERAERVRTLARRWPGLAIAGNALGGVGLPDCVREGETAADDLLKSAVANPS